MVVVTRSKSNLSRGSRTVCAPLIPVEATKGLPDLESLPLHQYRPATKSDGDKLCDLTYNAPRVNPRQCDYVVDPADWTSKKRGCDPRDLCDNETGAPQGADTVESILGADIAEYQCEVCEEVGNACLGKYCIPIYQSFLAGNESKYLEIRDAGIMGKGVFAKRYIKKGTVLCEYTGRLVPLDLVVPPSDNSYTWHVSGTCHINSVLYGNIGRFVNHHCTQYNCDSSEVMYGRRKVIAYQAKRAIAKGEQLYVNYGTEYFDTEKTCLCTAAKYPHLLGPHGHVTPAPTNKMYLKARSKVNRKDMNNGASPPKTKVRKLNRRKGVVTRSML